MAFLCVDYFYSIKHTIMKNLIRILLIGLICFLGNIPVEAQIPTNIVTTTTSSGVQLNATLPSDTSLSYIWYVKAEGQPGANTSNTYNILGQDGGWLIAANWFNKDGKWVYCDGRNGSYLPITCSVGWSIALFYDGRPQTGCVAVFRKTYTSTGCYAEPLGSTPPFTFKAPLVTSTVTVSTTTTSTTTSSTGTVTTETNTTTRIKPGKGKP